MMATIKWKDERSRWAKLRDRLRLGGRKGRDTASGRATSRGGR